MDPMKVLICDAFEESGLSALKNIGCQVTCRTDAKTEEALVALVAECQPEVLVVRSTKVTAKILGAAPLKLVVRAGAGVNTIDIKTCSKTGIYVSNCPGKNSIAVAELAFALILALDRKVVDNTTQLRQGQWNKKEFSKARGLFGRTLGLIGVGNIGAEMIVRAKAFGLNVTAWSRSLTDVKAASLGIDRAQDIIDLVKRCDILSLHVAYSKETHHLLNLAAFQSMRPGTLLVNTARAEVIDPEALAWGLKERGVRYATDVHYNEPAAGSGPFSDPWVTNHGTYGTHHIGASTDQAQEAIAAETVRIIETFKNTGKVPNAVNLARHSPATHSLTVRHHDRPGVLASVLSALRSEKINVQEMENIIFDGAEAAVARINLDSPPSAGLLENLKKSNADIINVDMFRMT